MPETLVYAYPWDFEADAGGAERAASLGVSKVVVAASYHSTRAARPLHLSQPLIEVTHAACYVPIRRAAWSGRRLVPHAPTWVETEDSFGAARDRLRAAGLATQAWVVLTHNGALGKQHPDLVVHNAFGDRYHYALCPCAPDVIEYCTTLVAEIVAAGPGDGLVLEACGPMGFEHNGTHEKTSLAGWSAAQRDLLSLCFCSACRARYSAAGLDGERLRQLVRRGILTGFGSVEELLGSELADAVAEVRTTIIAEFRSQIAARVKCAQPNLRVTVHGSPERWATGSFATLAPALGPGVDAVVTSCFDADRGTAEVSRLRAFVDDEVRRRGAQPGEPQVPAIGGMVRATHDWADELVLRERLAEMRAAGLEELHLYHLGLVGEAGLGILGQMASVFNED